MPVTLCIPVLKRYDLLVSVIQSLPSSTIVPDVMIFNNGCNLEKVQEAISVGEYLNLRVKAFTPDHPSGVAKAFNYFLKNVPETRVIMSDDVVLAPDSIAKLLAVDAEFVNDTFAFFTIKDLCIAKVGYFDEEISPDYAYFEDWDYHNRLVQAGVTPTAVATGMTHLACQTLAVYNAEEMEDYRRRLEIARENYYRKWPNEPRQ